MAGEPILIRLTSDRGGQAGVGAGPVDEGHHHDPTPQVGQGESRAILQDEGEVECRANPREPGIGLPWVGSDRRALAQGRRGDQRDQEP
jgi:hypothetical protein